MEALIAHVLGRDPATGVAGAAPYARAHVLAALWAGFEPAADRVQPARSASGLPIGQTLLASPRGPERRTRAPARPA